MPEIFERLYQAFLRAGGFDKPALREDIEREYRQLTRHQPEPCPHGKTKLTCDDCNFQR